MIESLFAPIIRQATGTAVLLAALVAPVAAQAPSNPSQLRLAWVNTQLILPRVPGYAAAESTLTADMAGYRTELEHLQNQLDSAQQDYQRQQIALSATARQAKQQELQDMQQRFQTRWNELDTLSRQRQQELLGPLQERVQSVIEGLRAERNLAFVFDMGAPGNNILAADSGLDLTAVVIRRLNAGQD